MNEENTKKLFDKFNFFHPETPVTESLMSFGFECGDGWFQLIWNLCENLEKQIEEELNELNPKEATKALLNNDYSFKVQQVKEKFGGLRFYISSGSDEIYNLIEEAENKSETICETCGKPGLLSNDRGWVSTLCKNCRTKSQQ